MGCARSRKRSALFVSLSLLAASCAVWSIGADAPKPGPPPAAPGPAAVDVSWEALNKSDVEMLLSKVSQISKTDKIATVIQYKQLFDFIGDHLSQIKDPVLKQKLNAAEADRKKLLAEVRNSDESRSATISALLDSGFTSIELSDIKAGIESLIDARLLIESHGKPSERMTNPDYLSALNGIAAGYMLNGEIPRAGEMFEDATPLGRATNTMPTRDLLWNRAAVDVKQKFKVLRSVKGIREYMEKNQLNTNEEMLNLLWSTLRVANENPPANTTFLEKCAEYYFTNNDQLEKTRPGYKHWGVNWMTDHEAFDLVRARDKAMDEYRRREGDASRAWNDYQRAQAYANGPRRGDRGAAEAAATRAKVNWENAVRRAKEAKRNIPQPPGLAEIKPVIPRGQVPEVASADSPRSSSSFDIVPSTPTPSQTISPPRTHRLPKPPDPGITHVTPPAPLPVPGQSKPPAVATTPPAPAIAPPAPAIAPPRRSITIQRTRFALAFPIDLQRLITAADVVGSAAKVRMQDSQGNVLDARVIAKDAKLALLEVETNGTAHRSFQFLNLARDFAGGSVQCVAIPEASVFGPQVGLIKGDNAPAPMSTGHWTVSLSQHPRLPGSPLINDRNEVVGVVVAQREDPRTRLPAVSLKELQGFLMANNAIPKAPSGNSDVMGVYEISPQ